MKGLFLIMVGLLVYLKSSAAQVSFRLQAPPPSSQQPPRSRFNFGRFQPMVNAIFSRNNRHRRPLLQHHPVDPIPFQTKPPPMPVMKPPFHTFEQIQNLPKKVPTVPLPPPPPPRHLLPDESLAYLQDGFGPPRPNSIIFTSSNLEKGNLESVPELKPLEVNDVTNVSIQDTNFPHLLTETNSNSDKFFPVIKPPLQQNVKKTNIEQQHIEGKKLSSPLISLNSVQLNPEAIFHFDDHQLMFFDAEPLKSSTIIQPLINNADSSLNAINIKGLRPPPFEKGNAGSFQGIQLPTFAPESQFSSVSEQQVTDTLVPVPLHASVDNDVAFVFPNTFTATNAGILPLANELPDVEQRFPPFI